MDRIDFGTRLAELERRLAELHALHREMVDEAHRLVELAGSMAPLDGPRPVLSVREAAAELAISESMLHKLIRDRRLGHLKVGARTLVTRAQIAAFQSDVAVGVR